jgi:phage gp45-like
MIEDGSYSNDVEATPPEIPHLFETGIIGHEDVDEAYIIGKDGGPIIARVQLFRGRDYTQPLKPGRMQGTEITARVRSGFTSLPPKGTEVLVAFPGGMSTKAGAGIIVAELSRVVQTATYGNLVEEEVCIHPGNADAVSRILMKKNNSINLYTKSTSTGKGMIISLDAATDTISIVNSKGYGIVIDGDGVKITAKDSGLTLGADGNGKLISKDTTQVDGAAIRLGSSPAMVPGVNSALRGPAGLAGVASLKVYIE